LSAPFQFWVGTGLLLVLISGYLTFRLFSSDQRLFLPGETTAGHYQIELACGACHTPFRGVSNEACLQCHGEQLKAVNDSHAPGKFADPRHAAGLSKLDARRCVSCHLEHRPAITRPGDVTQPADHCFHCHADVVRDRPSHSGFGQQGCATAGCHNYHDNTALYEDFLVKHLAEPERASNPVVVQRNFGLHFKTRHKPAPVSAEEQNAPLHVQVDPALALEWETTAHARAGVNCSDCHMVADGANGLNRWTPQPGWQSCRDCHLDEVSGFLAGRHGMRLERRLPPMSPELARLPMNAAARHRELTCLSCHGPHQFDTRQAAVESCLGCHQDEHSLAYRGSPHFQLWEAELRGEGPAGSGVSCATCHLPREQRKLGGTDLVTVQHNQNFNLRPKESMMRGVCLSCHGLEFSFSALLDPGLLRNNFRGRPTRTVETLNMVEKRLSESSPSKPNPQ
jgi:hypothetical protein